MSLPLKHPEIPISDAVNVLKWNLMYDAEFYEGYKSNIAMAFKDEYKKQLSKGSPLDIHEIANAAADNFLRTLCNINHKGK